MKALGVLGALAMKPETEYRIWYFKNIYGRAEVMRLLLTHKGICWEEFCVEPSDWPHLKPLVCGGGLPQLECKDSSIKGGATKATVRYLGLCYGYYPDDPMQA